MPSAFVDLVLIRMPGMTLQGMPGMMVQGAGGQVTQNFTIKSSPPISNDLIQFCVFRLQCSILGSPQVLVDPGWLVSLGPLLPQSHPRLA